MPESVCRLVKGTFVRRSFSRSLLNEGLNQMIFRFQVRWLEELSLGAVFGRYWRFGWQSLRLSASLLVGIADW